MVKETLLKDIGKQIMHKRLSVGMTQEAVDNAARIPVGSVRKYEKGLINITLESMERICAAMGCKIEIKIRKIVNWKSDIEEDVF